MAPVGRRRSSREDEKSAKVAALVPRMRRRSPMNAATVSDPCGEWQSEHVSVPPRARERTWCWATGVGVSTGDDVGRLVAMSRIAALGTLGRDPAPLEHTIHSPATRAIVAGEARSVHAGSWQQQHALVRCVMDRVACRALARGRQIAAVRPRGLCGVEPDGLGRGGLSRPTMTVHADAATRRVAQRRDQYVAVETTIAAEGVRLRIGERVGRYCNKAQHDRCAHAKKDCAPRRRRPIHPIPFPRTRPPRPNVTICMRTYAVVRIITYSFTTNKS